MKRLRLQQWTGQALAVQPCRTSSAVLSPPVQTSTQQWCRQPRAISRRFQSMTAAASDNISYDDSRQLPQNLSERPDPLEPDPDAAYPSPLPEKALRSPKLAALHARLSLSDKIPLQTLARTLVDPSADASPRFNNANLAFLGGTIINYHTAEWLMCRYPRLPMAIAYAALGALAGTAPLHEVSRQWGVESAAVPGGEVDPGLLQFSMQKPHTPFTKWGYQRVEAAHLEKYKWRRGMNSRVVLDDDFGDMVAAPGEENTSEDAALPQLDGDAAAWPTAGERQAAVGAHGNFVRAVVGAVYAHCGLEPAKAFVKAHMLARTLDMASLFAFKAPTRELALLCARESFEPPVARLLSETGRLSRTPVFVVGIYSGNDKLGEGAGWSLEAARAKAAINALKAWYLYSPGQHVRVPSDMLVDGAKAWEPVHIDIGEIV